MPNKMDKVELSPGHRVNTYDPAWAEIVYVGYEEITRNVDCDPQRISKKAARGNNRPSPGYGINPDNRAVGTTEASLECREDITVGVHRNTLGIVRRAGGEGRLGPRDGINADEPVDEGEGVIVYHYEVPGRVDGDAEWRDEATGRGDNGL